MIRPLRQRHRVIVCALGVLVPVAFVAGIAARRTVPVVGSVAPEIGGPAQGFGRVVWTKPDVWPGQRIITSLRRDDAGSVAVELSFRDLVKPDVLVYWTEGQAPTGGKLPEDARLLGALASRSPLAIPDEVRGKTGRFALYSLANHEVVTESYPFIVAADTKRL